MPDRFTFAILALLVVLAAALMVAIFRMELPKATTPLGPEPKPEPKITYSGDGVVFEIAISALKGAAAVLTIAAGVYLGIVLAR